MRMYEHVIENYDEWLETLVESGCFDQGYKGTLIRNHERDMRAQVRDLEAALDELAHWRGSMHGEAKRMRARARAALGAVPQPARCPTCGSDRPMRRDMPCSLSLYAEAAVIRAHPFHGEVAEG